MKKLSKNLPLILASLLIGTTLLVVGCESSSSNIYGSYYGNDGGASYNNNSGYYDPWYGGGYYGPGYGYGYHGGGAIVVVPPVNRPSVPRPMPMPR
jgi:hypothetical protein